MKVLFTVRREYFDAVVAGTKKMELRRADKRWTTVVSHQPTEAVFLCGRQVHRRKITGVRAFFSATEALGRPPSRQGWKDIGKGPVFAFYLGEAVR